MKDNTITPDPTYKTYLLSNEWHSVIIGFFIGIFMITIYFWMASGFINLLIHLYHSYPDNWTHEAENMIKDTVVILASFELIRVFQSYLLIGRVKVTFILDVALVVLIGELISLWYVENDANEVLLNIFVIASLIAFRIITTKFSPD
ncbi:hypothetical protein Noc_0432 [Nitrosococcus oceani ATCC 19707]|uniref:Phosphate-starvation-inducible E n=2 Tax=Nitrosococcus oceani TaxID=1229 RepID=Q3JDZ0_NITOC|nr:phosphate-starvation-inducible PsiE family protein [Nitrosococcus oceani]ABA56956.1 hypothetical protein Noc_0432 [Nitrosococcus oceani ATCC 19707]EDZ66316.1 hypothetical protein NOC27_2996 [Nitrosococcus oceani AFC27]KFI20598.1 hypothetical protein IB75_02235 [Nitrosococcus oceani C-27]GEM20878.1 hypothetical protein NONS58_23010 [Nitrosococcus oceani]